MYLRVSAREYMYLGSMCGSVYLRVSVRKMMGWEVVSVIACDNATIFSVFNTWCLREQNSERILR